MYMIFNKLITCWKALLQTTLLSNVFFLKECDLEATCYFSHFIVEIIILLVTFVYNVGYLCTLFWFVRPVFLRSSKMVPFCSTLERKRYFTEEKIVGKEDTTSNEQFVLLQHYFLSKEILILQTYLTSNCHLNWTNMQYCYLGVNENNVWKGKLLKTSFAP